MTIYAWKVNNGYTRETVAVAHERMTVKLCYPLRSSVVGASLPRWLADDDDVIRGRWQGTDGQECPPIDNAIHPPIVG